MRGRHLGVDERNAKHENSASEVVVKVNAFGNLPTSD